MNRRDMEFINKLPDRLLPEEMKKLRTFLDQFPGNIDDKDLWFRFERGSGTGTSVYVKFGDVEENITDYYMW